jgi:hypothetical protein
MCGVSLFEYEHITKDATTAHWFLSASTSTWLSSYVFFFFFDGVAVVLLGLVVFVVLVPVAALVELVTSTCC